MTLLPSRTGGARPVFTRSSLMLEVAEALASDDSLSRQQASIQLRPQGGGDTLNLFASDSPDVIGEVARGAVHFAIVNPGAPLTMAYRGTGPFLEPIPVRTIAVIPSQDWYVFAVKKSTGITSLEELRDRRYPLRVSLRGQRDHGTHLLEREALRALGFSLQDVEQWGGQVRYDAGRPPESVIPAFGGTTSRIDLARRGEIDAIFDESASTWAHLAVEAGMTLLSLGSSLIARLEEIGFRRTVLSTSDFPFLAADVLSVDFSGWPIYTHASMPDAMVTAFCAGLESRKDRIPWQGDGPLPLDKMCKDSVAGPLDVPLHPAAERFWHQCGYL